MRRLWIGILLAALLASTEAKDKSSKSDKNSRSDHSSEKSPSKSEKSEKSTHRLPEPLPPAGPAPKGYEAFRYVRTRNIFDPTRRGTRLDASPVASTSNSTHRSGALALTGTMVTDGRALAFFGGAENRVIGVGDSVAGFKVSKITPAQVSLERDGRGLLLDVGRQIALEGPGGEPLAGAPVIEAASAAAGPSAVPGVPGMPPAPPNPGGGDKSEILRRMMERRAQEVGK